MGFVCKYGSVISLLSNNNFLHFHSNCLCVTDACYVVNLKCWKYHFKYENLIWNPPVRSALQWLQPWQRENCTVKYADDITIICQIFNNDEGIYQEEINSLAEWWPEYNLVQNVSKSNPNSWVKNKGDKDTHPCLQQWSSGGAGELFKFLRILREPDMDIIHLHSCKKWSCQLL